MKRVVLSESRTPKADEEYECFFPVKIKSEQDNKKHGSKTTVYLLMVFICECHQTKWYGHLKEASLHENDTV